MTAREMFNEIGFEFEITKYDEFKPDYNYINKNDDVVYFDLEDKELIFMPTSKQFIIRNPLKFIQAINQQIKELNWDD